jgi:hypothetical protein
MSATLWHLNRHHDVSGVSGEGDGVATICEFPSGLIALHWNSDTPSVTVYTDIRHIEKLHGHEGASTVEIAETRLERAYRVVMPWLLAGGKGPFMCGPHPDQPDRLRLIFQDQAAWARWIALFDGSTHAATHVEVNGELRHRWIDPEGDIWMEYFSPLADDNDPLETFHREDR